MRRTFISAAAIACIVFPVAACSSPAEIAAPAVSTSSATPSQTTSSPEPTITDTPYAPIDSPDLSNCPIKFEDDIPNPILSRNDIIDAAQVLEAWKQITCQHATVWPQTMNSGAPPSKEQAKALLSPYFTSAALASFLDDYDAYARLVSSWGEVNDPDDFAPLSDEDAARYLSSRAILWADSPVFGSQSVTDFRYTVLKSAEVSGTVDRPEVTFSVESYLFTPRKQAEGWPEDEPLHAYMISGSYTVVPAPEAVDAAIVWQISDADVSASDVTWPEEWLTSPTSS